MSNDDRQPRLRNFMIKDISSLDGLRDAVMQNPVLRLTIDPGLSWHELKRSIQASLGPEIRKGFAHFENIRSEEDLWLEVLNALGFNRKPFLSCKESVALVLGEGTACLISTGLIDNAHSDSLFRALSEQRLRLNLLLFAFDNGGSDARGLVSYDRASIEGHISLARAAELELSAGSIGEAASYVDAHYDAFMQEIRLSIMHGDFPSAGELALALAQHWQRNGRATDRYIALRECVYACSSIDPARYAELACRLGRAAFEAGDYDVMLEAVYRANDRLSGAVDPSIVARLKGVHLAALDAYGRIDEAIGVARELASLAGDLPTAEARVIALINASAALGNACRIDEAVELLGRAEALARAHGIIRCQDAIARNKINLLIMNEEYSDARDRLKEENERTPTAGERAYGSMEHATSIMIARAYLLARDGEADAGRRAFGEALSLALNDSVPRPHRFLAMMGAAECCIGAEHAIEGLRGLIPVFDEAILQGHWRHLARALELTSLLLPGLSAPSAPTWQREAMNLAQVLRARTGQRRSPWEERQWASLADPGKENDRVQLYQTESLLTALSSCRRLRHALSRLTGSDRSAEGA